VKVNAETNRVTLANEAAVNAACRLRIDDYLARTGLSAPDFARRIGYGASTMRLFLANQYHNVGRSAHNLVDAACEFMDKHPVGETGRVLGELYPTANVRTIQDTFGLLLPRPVAYMLYAPPGSQKSFVLEHQVARVNREELAKPDGCRAFYVYASQSLRPRNLMRRVAIACGCRVSNEADTMLSNIRFDFRHHRVVLVVDEAQHLSIECFETLRELLDQPPYFSLLFAGSHDLKRKFDEFSATLEQWNSRIIAKVRLPGLEQSEARAIIEREIGELIASKTPYEREALAGKLISAATVRDAFEGNRTYINVRTLTNALEQIKAASAAERAKKVEVIA
jgi:AAA domain